MPASKRSYVHVRQVPHRAVEGGLYGWCGRVGTGRVGIPGTGRVVYRVLTQPVGPGGPYWYCQGPTHARNTLSASTQALQASLRPSAHLGSSHSDTPPSGPIWARFHIIYTKVSHNSGVST